MADSSGTSSAKVGLDVEEAGLRKYLGYLGKINKAMRDEAKEIKKTNGLMTNATVVMEDFSKTGDKIATSFKVMDKYAKLLSTTIKVLSKEQKRSSELHSHERAEIAANLIVKAQLTQIEKDYAIALARNTRLKKALTLAKEKAQLEALNIEKRKQITLEKAEADAYRESAARKIAFQKQEAQAYDMNNRMKKQAAAVTERLSHANKALTISAKSVARVLEVLLIRRVLHQLVSKMRESIDTIEDFHRAITEVQTIAQSSQESFSGWANSIEKVAIMWDVDLLDAANARYEILSNQIAKGRMETELFSEAAFKFAKITRSTATDSVNLLTASLNAYGETAYDVEKYSAILFKTIELGRIRSADLANTMGKALVPAAQLGIEMEELSAMMATITIKGVKATEAMTLIRGVMMKLMKPTEDMKDLFAKWGVRTGEMAIATYGLYGVMELLEEATRGTGSEIAKLFGRIRATMGVTAVVADLEKFNDTLNAIKDSSAEAYLAAGEMQFQTAGEQVGKAFNELQIWFDRSFGEATVNMLADYNKGAITIVNTISNLTTAFISVAAAGTLVWGTAKLIAYYNQLALNLSMLKLYRAGTISATEAQIALNAVRSFKTLAITAALAIATFGILKYAKAVREATKAIEELEEDAATWAKSQESASEKQRTSYAVSIEGFKRGAQEMFQAYAQVNAMLYEAGILIEEKIEADEKWIKEHSKLVVADAKDTLSTYKDMYSDLMDLAKDYQKELEEIEDTRKDYAQDAADEIEDINREYRTPKENIAAIEEQLKAQQAATAATGKDMDARLESLAREKEMIFDLKGMYEEQAKAAIDRANKQRARMAKMFGGQKPEKIGDRQGVEPDFMSGIFEQLKRVNDAVDVTYKKQAAAAADYQATALDMATQIQEKYAAIALIFNQINKRLGDKEITETLLPDEDLMKQMVESGILIVPDEEAWKKTAQEFVDRFDKIEPLKQMGEGLKLHSEKIEENTQALTELIAEYTKQLGQFDAADTKITQIMEKQLPHVAEKLAAAAELFDRINRGVQARSSSWGYGGGGTPGKGVMEQMGDYAARLAESAKVTDEKTKLTTEEQAAYIKSLEEWTAYSESLRENLFGGGLTEDQRKRATTTLEYIDSVISELAVAVRQQKEIAEDRVSVSAQLDEATAAFQQITADAALFADWLGPYLEEITKLTKDEMDFVKETTHMFGENLDALTTQIKLQLQKLEANPMSTIPTLAGGGSVWGTDTVPVRLTPGEFVMNQKAASKFYGQLTSMNAGGYGQASGDYSTHVGELTVNVQGGNTESQSITNIMAGIRRGIHRGQLGGI